MGKERTKDMIVTIMHYGGQRIRGSTSLQNSPNDTVAGSSSGCGTLVLMIQCRYPGEVLKYATEQRRFVPRVDSLELSQADVGRDTIWVLWDVHTPGAGSCSDENSKSRERVFGSYFTSSSQRAKRKGGRNAGGYR